MVHKVPKELKELKVEQVLKVHKVLKEITGQVEVMVRVE